jgi:hypothetical protein
MSHFAVLVIGDNIEEQLAPYQENNMGDCPQEYLEFNDVTDEHTEEYNNTTKTMVVIEGEEGYFETHDNRFKKVLSEEEFEKIKDYNKNKSEDEPFISTGSSGWGTDKEYYQSNVYPENAKEVEVPFTELMETVDEYITDYCGYSKDEETGRFGYWENPDAKWDWYSVGGRYAGILHLKEGVEKQAEPGFSWGWDAQSISDTLSQPKVDMATKKDVDWDQVHHTKESYDKAIRFWEMYIEGAEPETEEEKEQLKFTFYKKEYYTERYGNKETYAKCSSAFVMWAVIKDGVWYEKGQMGWWAMSDESHDEAIDWDLNFYDRFIKDLPEDTQLTIVDCHI